MTGRVDLEPAYVLHTRSYRETSQILEVFSHSSGRIGLVARGSRRAKSKFRGILNPFQPLRLSWSAKTDLGTLREAEPAEQTPDWAGEQLMAGFYLNELLMKLLQRGDPHPALFSAYTTAVGEIGDAQRIEAVLRRFEISLLREIGYALNLETDAVDHVELDPEGYYEFQVESGAVRVAAEGAAGNVFRGAQLLSIARLDFSTQEIRACAKKLLRPVISHHLGDRQLETRRIAAAMKR